MTASSDLDAALVAALARYRHDPLGFVQFMLPWGEPNGPLRDRTGPQTWQAEELIEIGLAVSSGNRKQRRAVASGKGIGKSALIAFISLWGLCTFPDTKVVLTAGTHTQLQTKTMPEIAKWFSILLCKHLFSYKATAIHVNDPEAERQKAWRLDAIPWNKSNPEAFQGLHNLGKRIIVLFDEASQIDDVIWDATDGVMSDKDTEVIWIAYGNPTRGIGKFKEAFDDKLRWRTRNIDSRDVAITDKEELAALVASEGGEDADTVRWMVRGLFPRVASTQFISPELTAQARKNPAIAHLEDPLVLGVDVARFGDAKSVICPRKGRDVRSIPWRIMQGQNLMEVANAVAEMAERYKPDAIHVDAGGIGAGVVDRLMEMKVKGVVGVQFGAKSDRAMHDTDASRYANKRSEMWGTMRAMLGQIAIPDWDHLDDELTAALYGYRNDNEIQLVSKEVMLKQHGVKSPDHADALALTYAYPVQRNNRAGGPHRTSDQGGNKALTDYDPYANL